MSAHDSQWPRWEVFKQDNARKVHQAVGSVHAADPEHALLTARHVFVRRPSAVSLWVAPADAIFSVTTEQLEQLESHPQLLAEHSPHALQPYTVFGKREQRSSMTYVDYFGEVEATSAAEALQQAIERFGQAEASAEIFVWWLIPNAVLYQSRDEDSDAWFEPAASKTYKQQSQYGTVSSKASPEGNAASRSPVKGA